jgi:hypothetical protein
MKNDVEIDSYKYEENFAGSITELKELMKDNSEGIDKTQI